MAFLSVFAKSEAQWTQGGNDGMPPLNIHKFDTNLFVLNYYSIFKSDLSGLVWSLLPNAPGVLTSDIIKIGNKLIMTTSMGIFSSDDGGEFWYESNNGVSGSNFNPGSNSICLLPNGKIFSCFSTNPNLWASIDSGQTWFIEHVFPGNAKAIIYDSLTQVIVCGTQSGVYFSNNFGQTWIQKNIGLTNTNIHNILISQSKWFAYTYSNNIFIANDTSLFWTPVIGLSGTFLSPSFVEIENELYCNLNTGVLKFNFISSQFESSNLNQISPRVICDGINGKFFGSKIVSGRGMYHCSEYTTDLGFSWSTVKGIKASPVSGFTKKNFDHLFFHGNYGGVYQSISNTYFFLLQEPFAFGTLGGSQFNSLKYQNQKFYAATNSGIWISNDSAQTWMQNLSGLPATQPGNYHYVYDIEVFGDTIIAGTPSGPYISTNGGISFSISNFPGATTTYDLLFHNGKLYSAGSPKMLVSSDLGANWTQFGSTTDVFQQMAAAGPYIYSASDQSIYLTIDSIGTTTNITGNLDPFIGIGNNPGIAAYDTLLFVSNFFRVGVHKMNINQPGIYTDVSDNLPVYEESPGFFQYPYLSFSGKMTTFDNKLWLGTAGMSCFTRPLSDFGYPPVVVTDEKNETKQLSKNVITIYPNPADETLRIKGVYEFANIEIYDLHCELLYTIYNMNSSYLSINVGNWISGIYFVKVSDGKGNVWAEKFVKH